MKKLIFLSTAMILFSPYAFVFANVEINEIMYDLKTGSDDGREWVEVYNNSDALVDFSPFKFFEGDTNHKMVLKQGEAKIPAGGYAIIVSDFIKFKTDHPNFQGAIFDSTFSLSNSGETLVIKNGGTTIDQVTYTSNQGGAGDGNSLQKINGLWQGTTLTPAAENKLA